ncbi:hypothetical protein ACFRDV_40545 [Streptomyces fagopyri]|uniref:hypothetical protein n=1 Tax=Streptomyces fagopyri TaxID=2662397 RepID=UPI0036B80CCD
MKTITSPVSTSQPSLTYHSVSPAGRDQVGELHSAMADAAPDHALREAEEHLSWHWNRLKSAGHPSRTPVTSPAPIQAGPT